MIFCCCCKSGILPEEKVNIPKISNFQWHPFSFSSSRNDEHLTFHISPIGDWTKELKKLALQYQTNQPSKFPSIYLKGPYGAPSQHYNDYKHLMVISTGVGATPFASILRHLSHKIKADSEAGVKTKSITFYWVNRKPSSQSWLNGLIRELQADEVTRELIKIKMYFTSPHEKYDFRSLLLWKGLEILHKEGVAIKGLELFNLMHWGKPDWDQVFKKKAQQVGKGKVGVFFCGNNYLAKDLHRNCLKHSGRVMFDFHKEIF